MLIRLLVVFLSTVLTACSISPHHAVATNDLAYLKNIDADEVNSGPYGSSDWTPFHVAAAQNNIKAMDILLDKGADPNAYSFSQGVAPIHLAVFNGHVDVVKKLLELGVELEVGNQAGASPLQMSVILGNSLIFKLLLEAGADPNFQDRSRFTALHTSAVTGKPKMARALVEAGADVNSLNSAGSTPLIEAAFQEKKEVIKVLIGLGADLNVQNNFGDTALHWAVERKNKSIAALLLEAGASPQLTNSNGITAKEMAWEHYSLRALFPDEQKEKEPKEIVKKPLPVNESKPKAKLPTLYGSGSSFLINNEGGLITNYHVVEECSKVTLFKDSYEFDARVVHTDYKNDLAYLLAPEMAGYPNLDISDAQQQLGEKIVVLGYPLKGLMGNTIKLTDGSLNALTGLGGDSSLYQISAPIQAGNSGGPVFNEQGLVIGVATSSLSASFMLKNKQSLPQNVNFAVKSSILTSFLNANQVPFKQKSVGVNATPKQINRDNIGAVAMVLCYR